MRVETAYYSSKIFPPVCCVCGGAIDSGNGDLHDTCLPQDL